jgi:hypothetical protein
VIRAEQLQPNRSLLQIEAVESTILPSYFRMVGNPEVWLLEEFD